MNETEEERQYKLTFEELKDLIIGAMRETTNQECPFCQANISTDRFLDENTLEAWIEHWLNSLRMKRGSSSASRMTIYEQAGPHFIQLKMELPSYPLYPRNILSFSANKARLACDIINKHCDRVQLSFDKYNFRVYVDGSSKVIEILQLLFTVKNKFTDEIYRWLSGLTGDLKALREAMAPYIAEAKLRSE